MTKQITTPSKETVKSKDYQNLLQELKSIIAKGQYTAYKAVDNIKVQTYWQIGERIVREELKYKDRADYGKYLVENLTIDLKISRRLLYEIIKFYQVYRIVHALHAQLSWMHYRELININDTKTRKFYEQQTILYSWGYRELHNKIKSQLYEKISPEEIQATFQTKLPAIEAPEIFKDTYDFKFIELKDQSEKELENKLMKNFELFLQELGEDIAILKRQAPLKVDNKTHYIDIVLYHRAIPCVILVDLKKGKIDSRDIGQMNKYVGYYRQNRQYEHEKDTIGLIICQHTGKEEIRYALDGLEEKIFIATYKVKLPSEENIKKAIKKLS